jgi:hypothetical protein
MVFMSDRDGDQHNVISCTAKGRRCTAMDKKKVKWVYDAHSEAEATLMCDAVNDRGYILPKFWRAL